MKSSWSGLGVKITALSVAAGAVPTLVTAWMAVSQSHEALDGQSSAALAAVLELKRARLVDWEKGMVDDAATLGGMGEVRAAVGDLGPAFDVGPGSPDYARALQLHDEELRAFKERHGYYDLFVIDPDGDVVYSVAREPDFGTNLLVGPYASTGLGKAFREARQGRTTATDFETYAPSNGAPAAFIAAPIQRGHELVGVVALQTPIDQIDRIMSDRTGLGTLGEAYLVGPDFRMRSNSPLEERPTLLATTVRNGAVEAALTGNSGLVEHDGRRGAPVRSAYGSVDLAAGRWAVIVEADDGELLAPVRRLRNEIIGVAVVLLAGVIALSTWIARRLAARLGEVVKVAEAMARGDFAHKIVAGDADEIGQLASAFQAMRDHVESLFGEVNRLVSSARNGDLSGRIDTTRYNGQFGKLTQGLDELLDAVSNPLRQVSTSSRAVSSAAEEIRASSRNIARGASEQAASLEETAASMEEISGMTKRNAESTRTARSHATQALDSARKGDEAVRDMVRSMSEIRSSATNTAEIIKNIDQIAFQTNLLALNAAVEAARAGEAGRGFAVVAEEVRNLALRSKEAAQRTEALIRQSVSLAENGEDLSQRVKSQLTEIVEAVGAVTTIVGEISAASEEQARGVDEVTRAITQMDQVVQSAAASAEESSSASHELAERAREMAASVRRFRLAGGAGEPPPPPPREEPVPERRVASASLGGGGRSLRLAASGGEAIDGLFRAEDDAAFEGF